MAARFDVVVIGAGPGGEALVGELVDAGARVALCERELVGGECAYWACIPSKTLLRVGEARCAAGRVPGLRRPDCDWARVREWRNSMVRDFDDGAQVDGYRERGVTVCKGEATIAGPGRVRVDGQPLETERIVVATGSAEKVPPIDGLADAGYWTNREATAVRDVPESVVVLGGGPVGIELGQMLARFGARVTVVEAGRLLGREEETVGEQAAALLRQDGIELRLGSPAVAVSVEGEERVVHTQDGGEARGRELVLALGRAPRVEGLGLDSVGIAPGEQGISVDERCRAGEDVCAIGDVTGVALFTHVAKYQARIVAADVAGRAPRADYATVPRVVFCDPEIGAVGMTEHEAQSAGIATVHSRTSLADAISRPWTYEADPGGELGLLADHDRQVLVGAWAVGPMAGEWIHYAALAIKTATPLAVLRDTIAQFPTYTEAYMSCLRAIPEQ